MEEDKTKSGGALAALALTTTIGMEIAMTVTLGFFGGRWLDNKFDTQPWFLVAGILLGLGTGIVGIVQTLERFWKNK